MSSILYEGPFKHEIKDFVDLKQATGYKYRTEERHLKRFDIFTKNNYRKSLSLNKEIVMDWCTKKPHETQATLNNRVTVIRQFALYLENIGYPAYIIPKYYFKKGRQYVPYIYTKNELKIFFEQTDQCHYTTEFPLRHLIMPIFFRLIYTCGLRVSEARLLKFNNVDLKQGILTIEHSKNDINRLVPISNDINNRCREYVTASKITFGDTDYFFPNKNGKPMTHSNIYKNFRRFLWKANISHGGRGFGPRIHDFRHTYAVHCLKKWSEEKKDLMVYLPILRVYLGHDSFEETAYYLRLTGDVYPNIILKLETHYFDIIPTLGCDYIESN